MKGMLRGGSSHYSDRPVSRLDGTIIIICTIMSHICSLLAEMAKRDPKDLLKVSSNIRPPTHTRVSSILDAFLRGLLQGR